MTPRAHPPARLVILGCLVLLAVTTVGSAAASPPAILDHHTDHDPDVDLAPEQERAIADPATLPEPTPPDASWVTNPYQSSPVTVTAHYATDDASDQSLAIQEAIEYWNHHAHQYAGFPITYDFHPDAAEADVTIVFVDDITACDDMIERRVLGCAPLISQIAPATVTIHVVIDQSHAQLRLTIKHELGHTLGLDHDDDPQDIMNP